MQLTAKEDIEAPLDKVFARLSDFDLVERQALRSGIEVRRVSGGDVPGAGMAWVTSFRFRGKPREADIVLTDFRAPETMVFQATSGGLVMNTVIDTVALSRTRTRVNITSEFQPQTLSARLLVQSVKLAKGGIEKRFRKRMLRFAQEIEDQLKG